MSSKISVKLFCSYSAKYLQRSYTVIKPLESVVAIHTTKSP